MTGSPGSENERETMAAPQARGPLGPEASPAVQMAALGGAAGALAAAAVRPKLPPPPTTPGFEADLLDD